MKAVTVEGRFSCHHCSKKCHKSHVGHIKPAVLFKSSEVSSSVTQHQCFSALLEEKVCDVDLGPVDQNWFEKALNNEIGVKELPDKELQEHCTHELESQKLAGDITETPVRHHYTRDKYYPSTPQLITSPCLFTPDERHPISQQTKKELDERQASFSTLQHAARNDISPATPSLIPITPNLPAEKRNPATWTPAELDAGLLSQGGDHDQEDPSLGGWCPAHKQTTPTFMKQLFKTPSTVSKLDDYAFATPGQFLSTPLRMSVSLGADLDDSNLSWTSSLATPQGSTHKKTNALMVSEGTTDLESTVIAKALFTSMINTPEDYNLERRVSEQDSQSSTLHLQSLHISSAEEEEEMLEDTIESDSAEDGSKENNVEVGDARKETENSGGRRIEIGESCDVSEHFVLGTTDATTGEREREQRIAHDGSQDEADGVKRKDGADTVDEEQDDVEGAKDEQDCLAPPCSVQNAPNLTVDDMINHPTDNRLCGMEESLRSLVSNRAQDDIDCIIRDKHPALIPATELTLCNPRSASPVEPSVAAQGFKQCSDKPQTDSQNSLENLTASDSQVLNRLDRSGLDHSRMEDTLAFFFLTPPQTRSRLAKLKIKKLAKCSPKVPDSSLHDKSNSKSGGPPSTSLEAHKILQIATRTSDDELLPERADSVQTKANISVIRLKEEDGSLKESLDNLSELTPCLKITNPSLDESLSSLPSKEEKAPICCRFDEDRGDSMLDDCIEDFKDAVAGSPAISALPSSSSKTGAGDVSSQTLFIQNLAGITPVRQTQALVSPPYINSPDMLSQISPNFAEALCLITDQVSESHFAHVLSAVPGDFKEEATSHPLPPPGFTVSSTSPSLPPQHDRKLPPAVNQCSSEQKITSEPAGKGQTSTPKSPCNQDTPSQLFRMQSKAATSRKFFYPSAAKAATKTSNHKAMQWVADAVLVNAEEKQQQQVGQVTSSKPIQEESTVKKVNQTPASVGTGNIFYSSTPAPRNSAFVTFTNFIKSERTSSSETSNPIWLTPSDDTATQACSKLNEQATHSSKLAEKQSNSSITANETTPLSGRTLAPRHNPSYGGIRRRAGTHGLPAPKRLKTAIEVDEEKTLPGEMGNSITPSKGPLAEIIPEDSGISTSAREIHQAETSDETMPSSSNVKASVVSGHRLERGIRNIEIVAEKHCTPAEPIIAKQVTTHMELCPSKSRTGVTPTSVSFASASGKPISISDCALEKARRRWSEFQEEGIPDAASFSSASGKPIQISKSALEKAAALFNENSREKGDHSRAGFKENCTSTLSAKVRLTSSHGSFAKVSDSAPQKSLDNQKRVSSINSAYADTATVLDFTNTVGPSVDRTKTNPKEKGMQPAAENRSSDTDIGDLATTSVTVSVKPNQLLQIDETEQVEQNVVCRETTSCIPKVDSECDGQTAKRVQCDQVPSFSGFASASGKAISISEAALQRAQKLFEDEGSENSSSTGFSSASGRPIQISESNLRKARALMDDWEDASCHVSKMQSQPPNQTSFQRQQPNRQTNNQNLSKGFRPFKAPARVLTPARQKTLVKEIIHARYSKNEPQLEAGTHDHKVVHGVIGSKNLESIPESHILELSPGVPKEMKNTASENLDFEEEFLSASQAQREIEAAEETESAYAFMQAENDSFSQFEETVVNNFVSSNNKILGCLDVRENLVAAAQNAHMSEDRKADVPDDEEHGNGPSELQSNQPSQVSFQASGALDIAFVQSQGSAVGEGETQGAIQADRHQEEGLIKSEHQTIVLSGNITAAASVNLTGNSSKSSHAVEGPFEGFQTARGKRVTFSEEALQKAKSLLDLELNSEVCIPLEPTRMCGTLGKAFNQNAKTLISEKTEMIDQQLQNDEALDSTVKKSIGESAQKSRAVSSDAYDRLIAKSTPAFSGFHTAQGGTVRVSEEALRRARSLLSEEEVSDSHFLPVNTQPHKGVVHNPIPDSLVKDCKWKESTNRDSPKAVDQTDSAFSVGSQTTRGETDIISEASVTRARYVLQKSEQTLKNQELCTRKHAVSASGDAAVPCGFTTASGNKVIVSQESLQQAKALFEDEQVVFSTDSITLTAQNNLKRQQPFPGFSTASGNKVSISETALEKAKRLCRDTEDFRVPDAFDREYSSLDRKRRRVDGKSKDTISLGFQTASGCPVSISEASLQTAKQLLDETPECTNLSLQASVGFQTASGNKVSLSAESLANAQRFLADAEAASECNTAGDQRNTLFGFSTASGAQVSVSDVALERARKLLQDPGDSLQVAVDTEGTMSASDFNGGANALSNRAATEAEVHWGDNSSDAVVPKLGGKGSRTNSSRHLNFKTKIAITNTSSLHQGHSSPQHKSFLHQRSSASFTRQKKVTSGKAPTAFRPPFQTAQLQTRQSGPRPGKSQGGLQVVPQVSVPFLPPKSQTPSMVNTKQVDAQSNKRTLDLDIDSQQAGGPEPKRARPEVGMEGESAASFDGKSKTVSSTKEEMGLPKGLWEKARKKQASRIQIKKIQVITPQPGELFIKRQQETRLPLHELVDGQPPQHYARNRLVESGIIPSTLSVTSSTAEAFRFSLRDQCSPEALKTSEGLVLGDGGTLVPDDAGTAGKEEFFNALLDTPGVDPKLLTADWVSNHYRWIVWKLAAMERAYPQHLAGRLLTPHWVLLQLKYRYDREIDLAQRSALKKILERDDTPSRRMVLCVAGISLAETSKVASPNQEDTSGKDNVKISGSAVPTLELTDGWYSIKTIIDKPLAGLVCAGKIHIGQKLCIYGAELVGSQDACSPLEVPANLRLKISANATRRARYDARLGLQHHPQPFSLPLASLYPEGGTVGCVDVVVVRSYPMQFMEKPSKGGCTFRGRRAEEKEAARFASEKQRRMEKLYNQIHEEYQEKENKKVNSSRRSSSAQKLAAKDLGKLQTGQELYEVLSDAVDPVAIEALLSERQVDRLHDYQRSLHEKKQADLQGRFKRALEDKQQENQIERNVTPLLRLRVADHLGKVSTEMMDTFQLTVWRPTDDIMQLLSEGKRLKIFNVSTSSGRFRVGSSAVQLASTRATRYQVMPYPDPQSTLSSGCSVYQPREVLKFAHALKPRFLPAYSEVDVVGVVVTVQGAATSPGKSYSQMVYLGDAQGKLIAIKFWGGLQTHCIDSLVKPGAFIASANLQWRATSASSSIPCLHATDTTSVTQNPKAEHLRHAMQDLQNQIKNPKAFLQSMEQITLEMILTQSGHPTPMKPRPVSVSPWSGTKPSRGDTATNATSEWDHLSEGQRVGTFDQITCQSFPSPAPANWTHQLRPSSASMPRGAVASGDRRPFSLVSTPVMDPQDQRRLDISRRFDLLSRVLSPPPLSPLPTPLTNRVTRSFQLPSSRRSAPGYGLSCGSNLYNMQVIKGQGSDVKCNNSLYSPEAKLQEETLDSKGCIDKSVQSSDFALLAQHIEMHSSRELADTAESNVKSENSLEDCMTPSQQQVQEVLGMSFKSLGEIDWEWTQQVDAPYSPEPGIIEARHSGPSPDFSYDTPSESPPPKKKEEDSLKLSVTESNTDCCKEDDKNLAGERLEIVKSVDIPSNKTSKKNLGHRSRREHTGRDASGKLSCPSGCPDSSGERKLMDEAIDQKGQNRRKDNTEKEQLALEDTEQTKNHAGVDEDKNLLKDEPKASKDVAKHEDENCPQDNNALNKDASTGQQMPLKPVARQKKRRERSRADLSILEQSCLLSDELGEPTRRLTRSSSRRSTVGK
ncbi:uncharacterized protein LOC110988636 [Acanthaster planci]|uniref:Uncharacterized protein LOC110988636 n=1 Tax=Acanthaster planci TaxID=133434 RepID=A0A8B7ZWZ1_ACAPL|nr:uncharacterized protein LOC110988636 [Acanthaster planci]XP_022108057.1 uncharacterized protein LOC110988636 [Acanthaster planci]XP_022108058.1 uncharacterized protein LOC110988636 [Acanthaster planci]